MADRPTTNFAELAAEIATWLSEQRAAAGAERFVLGLSGGVDSAVVCALCAKAGGPERVLTAIMPSHSNPNDAEHAALVAERFDVATVRVDLTSVTESFLAAMPDLAEHGATSDRQQLATANVRPRLRMTTLYYLANLANGIVVGTGNKSEAQIGYFTKYGDGGVDLLPLLNLYKHEVRGLARELGVPESIITKAPSAGLWPDQTDEAEIGVSYDDLDAALAALERGDEASLAPAVRERVITLQRGSEHKRRLAPAFQRG
ncbi:MAG: NAD+ synthase [Chloroflexota bacterium]|nr:NAD+ synthase [Chloroflexota bacterium]